MGRPKKNNTNNDENNNDVNSENLLDSEEKQSVVENIDNSNNESADDSPSLVEELKKFLKKTIDVEMDEDDSPGIFIPTGINLLDKILGGGIPNRIVQFIGEAGSGKTALACKIIAAGQKKFGENFVSVYIDTEQSITQNRLNQLGCVYPVGIINDGITLEKVFSIIDNLCEFKEKYKLLDYPSCVVWDSIANTLSEKSMSETEISAGIDDAPKILKHLISRYLPKIKKYNISLLCINQLRDKIVMNPYAGVDRQLTFLAANKKIPGGTALIYNSSQILYIKQREKVDDYGFKGVKVSMFTAKNRFFTPAVEIDTIYDFSRGFLNFWTDYEFLKKNKRITVNGGWVSLLHYSGGKCFQKEVLNKYKTDEEFRKEWNNNLREALDELHNSIVSTIKDSIESDNLSSNISETS